MIASIGKPLSPAERDVLFYTALGLYAKEIADIRCVTKNTIKNQRSHAFTKLGVYSSSEAIALLLVTNQEFYDKVKQAILAEEHKPYGPKGPTRNG